MNNKSLCKGILGFKKNPKQPILFGINGEMWPSDDSEDSDFVPEQQQWNKNVTTAFPANSNALPKPDAAFVPPAINYSDCVSSNGENSETEPPSFQVSSTRVNGLTFSLLVPGIKRLENIQEKGHRIHSHKSKKSKKKKKRLEDKEEKRERKKKRKHDGLMSPDESKKKRKKHKKSKRKDMEMLFGNGQDDNCMDPFIEGPWGTAIPENVLEKIFSYIATAEGALPFLPRMCKVCKLWNKVAQFPTLWVNMDFSWGRVRTSEILLIKLCLEDRLTFTRELNLAGWGSSLTQKGIEAVVAHCRFLTTINLSRCVKIVADCIRLLADNCPKLSSIDLSGTCKRHNGASPVSPASIRHLVAKCGERLTRLYLAENDVAGFTSIIKSISESCPNLQVLDLSNLQYRSQSSILPLEDLQHGCPSLRVLRLANSSVTLASTSLTEQAQSHGFPNLEELSIAVENGVGMGDSDLERLLKASHKLRLLDVRGCRNISVSGLIRVPAWDIQHLYLSQCAVARKQDLELVLQKWGHSLKEIDLSRAINEEAINLGMAALAATEQECPLKALDLSGSAVSYNTIKLLLSKCTHLDTLNLQSCRSLPRGMKRLYMKDDLVRLHEEIDEGRFAESSLPIEI